MWLTCGIQWITVSPHQERAHLGLDLHPVLLHRFIGFITWPCELIDQIPGHHGLMSSLFFYFFIVNDRISVNILCCGLYFPAILSYLSLTWGIYKFSEMDFQEDRRIRHGPSNLVSFILYDRWLKWTYSYFSIREFMWHKPRRKILQWCGKSSCILLALIG